MKVILKEAIYVPLKALKQKHVDKLVDMHMFRFYDERACRTCEHKPDRHSDICDTCPAYKAGVQLGSIVKENDKKYVKLPHGAKKNIEYLLDKWGYPEPEYRKLYPKKDDTRIKPFEFTAKLRDYQPAAVEAMFRKRFGILVAPARTGKTVMGSALVAKCGVKTIILASQKDWLDGFYETFVGSETQEPMTNLKRKRIGYPRKLKEFKKLDICLCTVQTFYSPKGKKLLSKIKDMFGLALCDEADTGAATEFARVLAQLNVARFLVVTATPDRKDGKFVIVEKLIGPIIHEIKVERLQPEIRLVETNYKPRLSKRFNWTNMVTKLESDPERLKLIAKWALKDMERKHMILIPISRVVAIKALVGAINKMAGKTVAQSFYGGVSKDMRRERIQRARKYKIKILVGQARLLTRGINIPRASALYEVTPSANLPQANQRFSRILTAYDGKPAPIVRYFLDPIPVRAACIKKEWIGQMIPVFKPIISEKTMRKLGRYFAENSNRRRGPDDSFDAHEHHARQPRETHGWND